MASNNYQSDIPDRYRTRDRRRAKSRQDRKQPAGQHSPASSSVRKLGEYNQPLSAYHYVFITIGSISIATVVLWYYVNHAAQLIQNGIEARFFYVLLILFGLSVAVFVFGVMNTYASYTGKHLSGTVKLGGPVVVLALTIIGGFYFPTTADTFDVTIRVFDEDSNPIRSGSVTLRLGPDSRPASIAPNGEVDFKEIPRKFQNTKADVDVDVKGYELIKQTPQNLSRVITLILRKVNGAVADESSPDTFSVTMRLFGPKGEIVGNGVVILYLGPDARSAPVAQNGEANFKEVPLRFRGTAVRIRVEAAGYKMADPQQLVSLRDVVNFTLMKAVPSIRLTRVVRPNDHAKTLSEQEAAGSRWHTPKPVPSPAKGCTAEEIRLKQCQP